MANWSDKVAIEYDEWYWHKNQHDKDCMRVNKLLSYGWRVITIRAHRNMPDVELLKNSIKEAKLAKNKYWHIITLEGWGK
jgi:very-short-patch-repair endonuclease